MQNVSLGLFAGAAILSATALVYAQSATPIEGFSFESHSSVCGGSPTEGAAGM
jgi:hypothetical protein